MSCELLSFNCGETFPNSYKPIGVQLWLVYKLTRTSPVTNTLIEHQKKYSTYLKKSVLT